jgi:hypothetical protein
MAMKKKEHDNEDEKKKGMKRNEASHAPAEGLNESPFGGKRNAQQQGRVLIITESTVFADTMEFSDPSKVKFSTLHDAGRWIEKGGVSKLLIIGSSDYYSHAVHDIGHCQAANGIGMVFLQTDGEKMDGHHIRDNTVCLSLPIDAKKISEAIGMNVSIKQLDGGAPENKMTQKVLIVTDSKEIAASLERAFKFLSEMDSEICTHSEFSSKHDIGKYENVVVIDSPDSKCYARDALAARHAMGAKNKVIFLSFESDEKPREGEIIMKIPFNLMELIKTLTG